MFPIGGWLSKGKMDPVVVVVTAEESTDFLCHLGGAASIALSHQAVRGMVNAGTPGGVEAEFPCSRAGSIRLAAAVKSTPSGAAFGVDLTLLLSRLRPPFAPGGEQSGEDPTHCIGSGSLPSSIAFILS